MLRFLRPILIHGLKRPFPLRARLTRPNVKVLTRTGTLATAAVTLSALALHTANDQTELDSDPDPDQTPLSSLLRTYLVFSLCSFPSLVDASPAILAFLSTIPVLRDVSEAFLKVTFFDQVWHYFTPIYQTLKFCMTSL
jgi:proline dehydrogenase